MSFKYSAFIENSKEAREWLESIGYQKSYFFDDENDPHIKTQANGKYFMIAATNFIKSVIDCRGNMKLFKAITAVRDDSDYMQWFTDGIHWEVCPSVVADLAGWKRYYQRSGEKYIEPWKASNDELINHFKK